MDIEQAREQAKNETTAPQLLAESANSKDYQTRQNVAVNPNTPTEILFNLGAEFPEELLNNPIFDLLLLENPDLIQNIPIKTLHSLIKQNNVPESFIIECAERESDRDLLLAMIINPTISRSVLEKLHKSKFTDVSEAAKLHINWSGEITEGWEDLTKNKIIDLSSDYGSTECHYDLTVMISAKLLPQDFLDYFDNTQKGKLVLDNIQKRNKYRSYFFIHKLTIPENISESEINNLEKMSVDRDSNIRINAATNPNTPVKIIENLSFDSDKYVRVSLVHNTSTPGNILEQLAQDPELDFVKLEDFAAHPNATHRLLENKWQELLTKTKRDFWEFKYLKKELIAFVRNISTPSYLLETIFGYRKYYNIHPFIEKCIAAHPNTPIHILEGMVNEKYGFCELLYLHGLIQNPQLPISLWKVIIENDRNKQLNYPLIIPQFCEQHPDQLSLILKDYSEASSDFVRLIALIYLPFEPNKLNELIHSTHWIFRYGVTQNINVSSQQLEKLIKDSNKVVRAAAKKRLENK